MRVPLFACIADSRILIWRPMKLGTVMSVLVGALIVAGCATTRTVATHTAPTTPAPAGEARAVSDSLRVAELRYREALGRYVIDECTEAVSLLERALTAIDAVEPATDDGRQQRDSLRSRVERSLDTLARRGYASAERQPAATAGFDTTAVRLSAPRQAAPTAAGSIPIVTNARVEKWLQYFKGRGRSEMAKWLTRTGRYRGMIEEILAEEGLPKELFYLSMIESGLNPSAYSRAHAAGMWQFISSRARMYGLRIDWWVDERRDPEKSTRAACAYLSDLYDMFGTWELALAAYNSGEGRVSRARSGRPSCPDFWCLDLPRETEDFVPKFMAALTIGSDPRAHGFDPGPTDAPLAYETVEVAGAMKLENIAKAAGVDCEDMKRLNPALRRWCTPPDATTAVRVPSGTADQALVALSTIPVEERVAWQRHQVSRGETLYAIAHAYDTTVNAILSMNDIRNPNRIRPGDDLVIPMGPAPSGDERHADAASIVTYRVRSGDTVSSIARRHGKRTADVLRWNGLSWKSKIYPGDTLSIHDM
jgi:membrane-bound lytic murein transglycosylase D